MDLSGKYRSSPEALTPFPVLLWGGVRVAGREPAGGRGRGERGGHVRRAA